MNLNIVIVDDHGVVRQGISFILKRNISQLHLFQAKDFQELIEIVKEETIDLILLDIKIPGGNTTDMIQKIRALQSDVKILMFSAFEGKHHALRYIQAGANGYLNKNQDEAIIVKAIKKVLATGYYAGPEIKALLVEGMFTKHTDDLLYHLSERERAVAELLVEGKGNLEIANQLQIHSSTVSTYKKRVYDKLEIDNLVDLVTLFKSYEV